MVPQLNSVKSVTIEKCNQRTESLDKFGQDANSDKVANINFKQ